jgi:abortive infection bacteriophage resistance protein
MKIEKKDINVFLALWIKSDPQLWGELRDIQIKLLLQRIVKDMSFAEMAKEHKVPEKKLRLIFEAILKRIEVTISKEIAYQLSKMNKMIENKNTQYFDYDFTIISLN